MMAILLLLVRIVLVLLLVRLALRFVVAAVRGYREAVPTRPVKELDMVRDRVCDTFLPRSRALVAYVDGREQHFCSAECRDRALRPAAP